MFTRKYNVVMSLFIAVFVLYIVGMNISIYNFGKSFAKEHGASSYEITLRTKFEEKELLADDGNSYFPIQSRFMFYNEAGENLIIANSLADEYHDLNVKVLNLEDTYQLLGSLFFVCTAFGLMICKRNRFNVSGYIILVIVTLLAGLKFGILNYFSVILIIAGVLGTIMTYKSRFIDWNESIFFTFGKKKVKVEETGNEI